MSMDHISTVNTIANNQDEDNNFLVYIRIKPFKVQKQVPSDQLQTSSHPRSPEQNFPGGPSANLVVSPSRNGGQRTNTNQMINIKIDSNIIYLTDPDYQNLDQKEQPYEFNGVLDQVVTNQQVFMRCIKPNLDYILQGFNSTIFAYGITGSGQSYTIFGSESVRQANVGNRNENKADARDFGLCYYAMQSLLDDIQSQPNLRVNVKFSYLEIYNENARDLLGDPQQSLNIIEDPVKGVIVQELKEFTVRTLEEIEELIEIGNQRRALAPTTANQYSSRSHAILIFSFQVRNVQTNLDELVTSQLTIIDLAGSEKGHYDKQSRGVLEGANINRSLLALGNCINILSQKIQKPNTFVPYRDSKLTRLLQDSLGGNTKTVMISCISQSQICFEETLNTLNYSLRATNIQKKVIKNVKGGEDVNFSAKTVSEFAQRFKYDLDTIKQMISGGCVNLDHVREQITNICTRLQIGDEFDSNCGESASISTTTPPQSDYNIQKLNREKTQLAQQVSELSQKLTQSNCLFEDALPIINREEYLERICRDMVSNLEEYVEIKESLRELGVNLQDDYKKLQMLNQCPQSNEVVNETEMISNTIKENQEIQMRMRSALQVNFSQKEILKDLLFQINQSSQNLLMEAEIKIRKKQIQCLELLSRNQEYQNQIEINHQLSIEKDNQISFLEKQLTRLKNKTLNSPNYFNPFNSKSGGAGCSDRSNSRQHENPHPTLNNTGTPISPKLGQISSQEINNQIANIAYTPSGKAFNTVFAPYNNFNNNANIIQENLNKSQMNRSDLSPDLANRNLLSSKSSKSPCVKNDFSNKENSANLTHGAVSTGVDIIDTQMSRNSNQMPTNQIYESNSSTSYMFHDVQSSHNNDQHGNVDGYYIGENSQSSVLSQKNYSNNSSMGFQLDTSVTDRNVKTVFNNPIQQHLIMKNQDNDVPPRQDLFQSTQLSNDDHISYSQSNQNLDGIASSLNNSKRFVTQPQHTTIQLVPSEILKNNNSINNGTATNDDNRIYTHSHYPNTLNLHQAPLNIKNDFQPTFYGGSNLVLIKNENAFPNQERTSNNINNSSGSGSGSLFGHQKNRSVSKSGGRYKSKQQASKDGNDFDTKPSKRVETENSITNIQGYQEGMKEVPNIHQQPLQLQSPKKIQMLSPVDSVKNGSQSSQKPSSNAIKNKQQNTIGSPFNYELDVINTYYKKNKENIDFSRQHEMHSQNNFDDDCDIQIISRSSHNGSEIQQNNSNTGSAFKNPLETESEAEYEQGSERVSVVGSPIIQKTSQTLYLNPKLPKYNYNY